MKDDDFNRSVKLGEFHQYEARCNARFDKLVPVRKYRNPLISKGLRRISVVEDSGLWSVFWPFLPESSGFRRIFAIPRGQGAG